MDEASRVKWDAGLELIRAERFRVIVEEGWDAEHDDGHVGGELALAASCYARPPYNRPLLGADLPLGWPWTAVWWKPTPEDRVRELVKAGALIAAEIDRLLRKEAKDG